MQTQLVGNYFITIQLKKMSNEKEKDNLSGLHVGSKNDCISMNKRAVALIPILDNVLLVSCTKFETPFFSMAKGEAFFGYNDGPILLKMLVVHLEKEGMLDMLYEVLEKHKKGE